MIGPAELEDIRLDLEAARLEREAATAAEGTVNAHESRVAPSQTTSRIASYAGDARSPGFWCKSIDPV